MEKVYQPEFYEALVVGNELPQGKEKMVVDDKNNDFVKTTKPNADLIKNGMTANDYYQLRLKMYLGKDPHAAAKGIPERRIVQGSRKFKGVNFFSNSDSFYFNMISEDLKNGDYVPLASEKHVAELPKLFIKGFFVSDTCPFRFYLTNQNADGTIEYLQSTKRKIVPGSTKVIYETEPADSNQIEVFIPWENEESGSAQNVKKYIDKEIERKKIFEVIESKKATVSNEDLVETDDVDTKAPEVTKPVTEVP